MRTRSPSQLNFAFHLHEHSPPCSFYSTTNILQNDGQKGDSPKDQPRIQTIGRSTDLKLYWSEMREKAPCRMDGKSDAVVNRSVVYIRNSYNQRIYAHDAISGNWSVLPSCPNIYCSG